LCAGYSWDIGRQINNATLRWPHLSYYENAKAVALCEYGALVFAPPRVL
jgi:hypothetical protein